MSQSTLTSQSASTSGGGNIPGDYLAGIVCPTLIIQGANDPWIDQTHAHKLHSSIQGSRLELFAETGHEVHREKPKAFNPLVLRFLSSVQE
ncbi:alpha/beta hydrolase [SAR202 cluster bacterium AC-647-N09_OGT_505m]|nr:alpha/beta hydrolase [SAR202 cluster bacterium AC-647-N09_OGT_505m]